jgi:hypothetical protein
MKQPPVERGLGLRIFEIKKTGWFCERETKSNVVLQLASETLLISSAFGG